MILSLGIREEEDKIAIDSNITYVIYMDMPRTRLEKKNCGAFKSEVA